MRRRSDYRIRKLNPTIYKFIIKKLIPIIKRGVYIKRKVFVYPADIELIEFMRKEFTKCVEVNKEGRR